MDFFSFSILPAAVCLLSADPCVRFTGEFVYPAFENSIDTTGSGCHFDCAGRTVLSAGTAFHTTVEVTDGSLMIRNHKDFVRADLSASSAADAVFFLQL